MKIIYFDYWRKGIIHFIPINSELIKNGANTIFIHTGSFRYFHPIEELYQGILCRDIRYYKTIFIHEVIKKERPDIVMLLNTTYLLDRAVILSCRKLKIKTVFMMHGIRNMDLTDLKKLKELNKVFSLKYKVLKIKKYIKIIPNYIYSLITYNYQNIINFRFIKVIIHYFIESVRAKILPKYSDELICDKCLIFGEFYRDYYRSLGYPDGNIKVVGIPQYDELLNKILNRSFIRDKLPLAIKKKQYAIYLEDSFPESNVSDWDDKYRNFHLNQLSERLKNENLLLVIKLHPTSKRENVILESNNSIIIKNCDLFNLIYYSSLCIGHISTTINIPLILNKPVVIPKWGPSEKLPDYFVKTGVANEWKTINSNINYDINATLRKKFLYHKIGFDFNTSSIKRVITNIY